MRQTIIGLGMAVVLLASGTAWGKCSKKEAEEKVKWACGLIEKKGKDALPEINTMRFCSDNYVWIQDSSSELKMVQHPTKPKLNGQSLLNHKDERNFPLFVEFNKVATSGAKHGWVSYVWAKPGAEKATDKTSYVELCKGDLKWVAGSGVWNSDL
jgi:signal transduction histidine kinase